MLEHYEDLSPYHYGMGLTIPEVVNIGWLDANHRFTTGDVESDVVEKLEELALNSNKSSCDVLVDRLRGSCACPVCGESYLEVSDGHKSFLLGSAEIWIPNHKIRDQYYATFGLIIHHVKEHHYQPPKEFIDSVLALDINCEFIGQAIKDKLGEKHFRKT
jgi:hypothetical protein